VDVAAPVVSICITDWALFVATTACVVLALDLQTFRPMPQASLESADTTLFMCADRQFLFTCGTDNTVTVWRAELAAPGADASFAMGRPCSRAPTPKLASPPRFHDVLVAVGAEKYLDVFAKNEIDYDALLLLNDRDLEEIGIPLGTRRKIVTLIDRLAHNTQRNWYDDDLIHFLRRLIAFETVSSDPAKRTDAWNCARLIEQSLLEMGAETRLRQIHNDVNPILIARLASLSPNAPKVVFYRITMSYLSSPSTGRRPLLSYTAAAAIYMGAEPPTIRVHWPLSSPPSRS